MPYQVPQNIDPNKIFLVNFSDLQGRLDPQFYKERFDSKHFIKLSSFANVKGGKRIPLGKDYSEGQTDYLYLRVADIDDNGFFDVNSLKYINRDIYEILQRYEIFEGDIAISIAGTIGKIVVVKNIPQDKHVVLTENCAKLLVKCDDVLIDYLKIVLESQLVQKQMKLNYIQTTIPKLGLDRIKSLMLPQFPPPKIQQQIIDYYNSAYKSKLEKHQQAEALLQSIDDYLLGELGITLPKKTAFYNDYVCCEPEAVYYTVNDTFLDRNNELVQKGQIFITKFSEVTGGRLDPKLYSTEVKELKRAIAHSKYQTKPLSYFVVSDCSGDWGKDESDNVEEDKYTKCLVIRATEFDNTYNLRLDNSRVKYRQINNSKLSKMDIKENDLLIEKSGGSEDQPVGRIAILTNDIIQENTLAYSNFVHKISVEGINPQYLYFYLKTMYNIGITEPMQSQTNGIRNLIMPEYFNQNIAFPSLSKQLEIANHITEIRKQAKQLQEEGAEILRKAKEEVERMILN